MATNDAYGGTKKSPSAIPLRRNDLVFEELDGEAVLYDPRSGAVHRFNATTLLVWNACDGSHATRDIAHSLTEEGSIDWDDACAVVERAITELKRQDLLQSAVPGAATGLCVDGRPDTNRDAEDLRARKKAERGAVGSRGDSARSRSPARPLSRRELLRGGTGKLILAAPLISTFFAAGAYASGPSASKAFGPGGCKEGGYSCTVNSDCCENECTGGICQEDPTCQGVGEICFVDEDCCSDDCDLGVCQ